MKWNLTIQQKQKFPGRCTERPGIRLFEIQFRRQVDLI